MPPAAAPRPIIGLTCDVTEVSVPAAEAPGSQVTIRRRAVQALTYVDAIHAAGGLAILLPPAPHLAAAQLDAIDALCLTGGQDIDMAPLGGTTHPLAQVMHPLRQQHEFALLAALDARPRLPALGVCLGMQLMCVHAGGRLNQHLPDTLASAHRHTHDTPHTIIPTPHWAASVTAGLVPAAGVASNHHQAVDAPGTLRVLAHSDDGVIEAIDLPGRPFYLGVQWHPERTPDPTLGLDIFRRLVAAAAAR